MLIALVEPMLVGNSQHLPFSAVLHKACLCSANAQPSYCLRRIFRGLKTWRLGLTAPYAARVQPCVGLLGTLSHPQPSVQLISRGLLAPQDGTNTSHHGVLGAQGLAESYDYKPMLLHV